MLYRQIHDYILKLIEAQPDRLKLPSERQLQETFNSTRITIRDALIRLEAEGVIYRLNRKGWFVNATRLNWDPVNKANFYALAQEQGFEPRTVLVDVKVVDGAADIRPEFKLEHGNLIEITRIRLLDGRPVLFEIIYCRESDFPDLTEHPLEGSITTVFTQQYGVEVSHERSRISVSALPEREAKALEQNEGASCLKIFRKRYAPNGSLVDYNIEYWAHGAIELEVTSSNQSLQGS